MRCEGEDSEGNRCRARASSGDCVILPQVLPAAEGRDEEKWSVCFSTAAVAADWRSDIDDIARRRNHGLRHAAPAPTSTPGSSQELRLRTRSGRLLEEVQDEPEKTVWAGELELQVQGSVGWLDWAGLGDRMVKK